MSFSELSGGVKVFLGILLVVQLCLQITAIVTVMRTPRAGLRSGSPWPWVVIAVFGNLVGAVVTLAVARVPSPAPESAQHPSNPGVDPAADARRAIDRLYGPSGSGDDSAAPGQHR